MSEWIRVEDRLPEIEVVVMVRYVSEFDKSDIYAFGARCDDVDGWLWGVARTDINITKDAGWNDVEADDDYPVTHWMPLPDAPK